MSSIICGVKETALSVHKAVIKCGKKTFLFQDVMKHFDGNESTLRSYLHIYYKPKSIRGGFTSYSFVDNAILFNRLDTRKELHHRVITDKAKNMLYSAALLFSLLPNTFEPKLAKKHGLSNTTVISYCKNGYLIKKSMGVYGKTTKLLELEKEAKEKNMDKGKNTGNPQNEASPKYQDIVMNGNGNVISMQEGLAYDPSLVIDMFLMMSNADKAKLVSTLFPIVTEAELLAKFDELYPDYIFPNTKQGDLLFHPLIGKVEITKASDHKLGFYGNGQEWVCNRNGHLIVNGKTHDRRLLFHDLKDYNDYMKGE